MELLMDASTPQEVSVKETPCPLTLSLMCRWLLLLNKRSSKESIVEWNFHLHSPMVTHLFFADDSLLFCRASRSDLQVIQNILVLYEQASGQRLNWEKTSIFFSKAVSEETKANLSAFFRGQEVKEYVKYLGLPAIVGKKKKASFNYIKERLWSKLQGWTKKLLSQAGREILLKDVVQAIPTFAMSCFKLPTGLCDEIEELIWKFY